MWSTTETRLHEPLEAIQQHGRVTDQAHQTAIREAVALHLVRSIQTAALHEASWLKFREFAKRYWLQRPGDLQLQHVARHGWWTSDPDRLEQVLDDYIQQRDPLVTSGALFRVSLEDRFERLRIGFRAFDLKILSAGDKEFLIGDAPVCDDLLLESRAGLGLDDDYLHIKAFRLDLSDNLTKIFAADPIPYAASPDVMNIRECQAAVYADLGKLDGKLPRLHIRYVTAGRQVSDGVQRKAGQAAKSLASMDLFGEVDFRCVTREELRNLYRQATEAVSASFDMVKKIPLPRIAGVEQTLLGLLSARDLVNQVLTDPASGGSIREALFHENVRGFQGYNDVNDKIRGTLQDDSRRGHFAILNNGITIVTRELTVAGDEVRISDFQIVNGCQTCHVLVDEREHLTDDVQVSVRLVHTQDKDIIGGIVAATNLQTSVSEQELSAREDFHRELEDFFACQPIARRLYYERRSRQYSSLPDVPKTRVISMSQLARAYLATFLEDPDRVGRFKDVLENRKNHLFRDDDHPIAYYTAAAAYYRLESLIRRERIASDLKPTRYHILSAMKLLVIGPGPLPRAPRKADAACGKLLDVIWDPSESEKRVLDLLPALYRAIDSERPARTSLSEMVRTRRFAERVRQEVLGVKPSR